MLVIGGNLELCLLFVTVLGVGVIIFAWIREGKDYGFRGF